jgi:hypothetical protein
MSLGLNTRESWLLDSDYINVPRLGMTVSLVSQFFVRILFPTIIPFCEKNIAILGELARNARKILPFVNLVSLTYRCII